MKNVLKWAQKVFKSPYFALIFRIYIGVVFLYSSLGKIPYPAEFAESLAAYQILPYWSVNFMAVVLPWIEFLSGMFLIVGLRTRAAASIIGSLLVVFIIAISINVVKGAPISCGCFDTIGHQIGWRDVFRDTGWLLLTLHIFFFDRIYFFRKEKLLFRKKF